MDKEKTCCVTGHRDIPAEQMDRIQKLLRQEILAAIEDGYTHFISGFAAGADLLFADIVAELKEIYLITLEAAIPYPGRMKTPDETFQRLIRCCDTVKIHSDVYSKGCYMRRNRYMVDQSQRVVAVYDGRPTGGTAVTVRYASGKDVRVLWR
ncbi:DUF1273 family protein [Pseudoflavonifractor sp. AF19-9AC]|uniref:SLOG family protein n=1 Tax=Pseudoflavonifractor sp. AF19-9AC TaxID=2292244 RepID=UPI000E4E5B8A|nr:SLOG family protein [Pseudoflavonifractor sp. AF19-9AC]RHR11004.1 DUF1273 family protein [Pseudoflavonifractor sp. AF19-9AC]